MEDEKEKRHRNYLKNKEKILERSKRWREKNKKKFYESVYKCRKRQAEKLKAEGVLYYWYSAKQRERMIEKRNERINRRIKKNEANDNGK